VKNGEKLARKRKNNFTTHALTLRVECVLLFVGELVLVLVGVRKLSRFGENTTQGQGQGQGQGWCGAQSGDRMGAKQK
jgi:hypothetical protein